MPNVEFFSIAGPASSIDSDQNGSPVGTPALSACRTGFGGARPVHLACAE